MVIDRVNNRYLNLLRNVRCAAATSCIFLMFLLERISRELIARYFRVRFAGPWILDLQAHDAAE